MSISALIDSAEALRAKGERTEVLKLLSQYAALLDGIKHDLDPGEPQNTNLYLLSLQELKDKKIDILPQNPLAAIDAVEADNVIMDALGPLGVTVTRTLQ